MNSVREKLFSPRSHLLLPDSNGAVKHLVWIQPEGAVCESPARKCRGE
jgi:hypothetical protein